VNTAVALFLACLMSGVVVPVPEDVPIILAGMGVVRGEIPLSMALVAGAGGTLLRDSLAFSLGRFAGPRIEAMARRRFGSRLDRAIGKFENSSARGQDAFVFLTRFAAGVRGPLYFVAGFVGASPQRFLALDALGLALTTPLCLWIGMTYGDSAVDLIQHGLAHQRPLVAAILVLGAAIFLSRRLHKRQAE
jgi:membrane protein DedA with SNARE-associated domain